jgi:hypothetical protein
VTIPRIVHRSSTSAAARLCAGCAWLHTGVTGQLQCWRYARALAKNVLGFPMRILECMEDAKQG